MVTGTREECASKRPNCPKLHFRKIIQRHTDVKLGDCSFLNTCFHMDSCKYIHYEVDQRDRDGATAVAAGKDDGRLRRLSGSSGKSREGLEAPLTVYPPQVHISHPALSQSVIVRRGVWPLSGSSAT